MELLKDIAVDLNIYESIEYTKTILDDKYFKEFIEVYIKIKNDNRLNKYKLLSLGCFDEDSISLDFGINKCNDSWIILHIMFNDESFDNKTSYMVQVYNHFKNSYNRYSLIYYENFTDALDCIFVELEKRDKLLEVFNNQNK